MKTYEIWCEGFEEKGNRAAAILLGAAQGETFKEACSSMLINDHRYNQEENAYWGCKLHDNEEDARKAFG